MNETQYRLLNVGEPTRHGEDEVRLGYEWKRVPGNTVKVSEFDIIRRPITPPEWIPIKDRAPEFPCVLGFWSNDGTFLTVRLFEEEPLGPTWTHWYPIPAPPAPPQSEDEKAFELCVKTIHAKYGTESAKPIREIFMAGVQHGRNGAK